MRGSCAAAGPPMNTRFAHRRTPRPRRRGIALLIVLVVIAMAAIFGTALLSSTAIQAQVGGNDARACAADYLAESGLQAGLYYLQYPQFMPTAWGSTPGYVIKASSQTVGASALGNFDLEVVQGSASDEYDITSTGHSPVGAATKTAKAHLKVDRVKPQGAAYFGGAIAIPLRTTMTGFVQANGSITNNSGNALSSTAVAPLPATAYLAPSLTSVNYFGADAGGVYTTPDGQTGHAQQLLSAPTSTPTAAADNPGKIFYYNGDLTLSSNVVIDGTLVVKNGSLTIRSNVTINATPGYPALIVERDVSMYRTSVQLAVSGVAWIGRNIVWTGPTNTGSQLKIYGALLMPAGATIGQPYSGGANSVTYVSPIADISNMTKSLQPGLSVKVLSWDQ